jgi:hypothetical protein
MRESRISRHVFTRVGVVRTDGRIYRMNSTGRELWRWTQSGLAQPSHGPNGGVADTLDEAKAAFRAAWERPLSQKQADEICSG